MSTTPKPYALLEVEGLCVDDVWGPQSTAVLAERERIVATVVALDASRAAFEQLQRDATSAAEKYLDAINDSEARAQAAQARVGKLEAECADADRLIERQSSLLTAAVNTMRGAPPSDVLWSHHDVADLARGWVDRAHVAESECDLWRARAGLKTIQRDEAEKTLTAARASEARMREALERWPRCGEVDGEYTCDRPRGHDGEHINSSDWFGEHPDGLPLSESPLDWLAARDRRVAEAQREACARVVDRAVREDNADTGCANTKFGNEVRRTPLVEFKPEGET